MPRSGATPACVAFPWISTVQRSAPIAPIITSAALAAVEVKTGDRAAEVGRVQVLRAEEAAFFSHGKKQCDRRVRQVLPNEFRRERDKNRTTGAVVAAERGGAFQFVDDALSGDLRLRARAQRHGIHVRHEQNGLGVLLARAGQLHDEVADGRWFRNAGVGVVEGNGVGWHTDFFECGGEFVPDGLFVPGNGVDRKEPQQPLNGGIGVEFKRGCRGSCDGGMAATRGLASGAVSARR